MFSFFRKIRNKDNRSSQAPVNLVASTKNSSKKEILIKSELQINKDYKRPLNSLEESDMTQLTQVYQSPASNVDTKKVSTEIEVAQTSASSESDGIIHIHKDEIASDESPDEFCEALETIPAPPANYETIHPNLQEVENKILEIEKEFLNPTLAVETNPTINGLIDGTNVVVHADSCSDNECIILQESDVASTLSTIPILTADPSPQYNDPSMVFICNLFFLILNIQLYCYCYVTI